MLRKILYLLAVAVGIYLIINLSTTIINLWQKQGEVTMAQKELETLKKENKDLEVQFEYSQTQEFLEKEAREKLGLVLPGEKQVLIDKELLKATEEAKPQESTSWRTNWEKWWKLFFY